uniref:AMP-dependent synthetase/ligase domain-containing protein n=1 Tax=Glossina austeni TaxID=7395 RepID=A0A1A9UWL2_GLOAU
MAFRKHTRRLNEISPCQFSTILKASKRSHSNKKHFPRQYEQNVCQIAKAFIKLGLEAHHAVGVLAFNCPEWFYSAMSVIHAGGIIVAHIKILIDEYILKYMKRKLTEEKHVLSELCQVKCPMKWKEEPKKEVSNLKNNVGEKYLVAADPDLACQGKIESDNITIDITFN